MLADVTSTGKPGFAIATRIEVVVANASLHLVRQEALPKIYFFYNQLGSKISAINHLALK
jgi:hypothetical protein